MNELFFEWGNKQIYEMDIYIVNVVNGFTKKLQCETTICDSKKFCTLDFLHSNKVNVTNVCLLVSIMFASKNKRHTQRENTNGIYL